MGLSDDIDELSPPEEQRGEQNPRNETARDYPERRGNIAEIRSPDPADHDDPEIYVRGYHYEDGEFQEKLVDMRAGVHNFHFWISMSPEEARELAADIAHAADYAATGRVDHE